SYRGAITVVQLDNSSPIQNTPSRQEPLKLILSHQEGIDFVRLMQGARELVAGYSDRHASADLECLSKQSSMPFVEYIKCPSQRDRAESNWIRVSLRHPQPPTVRTGIQITN